MAKRDLVAIGGSAGALETLQKLAGLLPEDFDAAILMVLHTSSHAGSMLPHIISRAGKLEAVHPTDGMPIQKRKIYIAPPDYHMLVEGNRIRVLQGPRENLHRPAIDPLFRSAAAYYGPRVVAVVLSGLLDDGTSGLMVVRAAGGRTLVQDPREALFSAMPQHALEQVPDAEIVSIADLPALLLEAIQEEVDEAPGLNNAEISNAIKEVRLAEANMAEIEDGDDVGKPSSLGCPDCGGVLREIEQGNMLRYRCRVGHAFTARYLEAQQAHSVESALWAALRALEESAALYRRMAGRAKVAKHVSLFDQYEDRAENKEQNARTLRDFLVQVNSGRRVPAPAEESELA